RRVEEICYLRRQLEPLARPSPAEASPHQVVARHESPEIRCEDVLPERPRDVVPAAGREPPGALDLPAYAEPMTGGDVDEVGRVGSQAARVLLAGGVDPVGHPHPRADRVRLP